MTITTTTISRDELIRDLVSVKIRGKSVDTIYEIKGIDKKSISSMALPNQQAIEKFISNSKAVIYVRKA